ncbi:MAG: PorV/PorQ family protein [bacterium]|nr:PorV/PorQ family protein [bacterium]
MKRIVIVSLLILIFAALPGYCSWLSDGKYAAEFLSIGVDARALGMGGAYVAQANGASAAYWNPAGLATLPAYELTLMHAEQFEGIVGYDYLGFAQPRRNNSGLGVGLIRLGVDDIPMTALENPGQPLGSANRVIVSKLTTDTELALFAGYGKQVTERLSYGASAKLLGKWVADNSAYGIGFDLGLRYVPMNHLALGALLQDATTTALIWDTGQKELAAPTLKLGGAYNMDIPALIARLTLAADFDLRFTDRGKADQFQLGSMTVDSHVGMEYFINVAGTGVALRAGAEPSRNQEGEGFFGSYTFGAGLLFRTFHIDYAFLAHPELGDTHRVALAILWGHRGTAGAGETH